MTTTNENNQPIKMTNQDGLGLFLSKYNINVIFSSYQKGVVGVLSPKVPGSEYLNCQVRAFPRATGIAMKNDRMVLGTELGVYMFKHTSNINDRAFDTALYPLTHHFAANLDIHEVCMNDEDTYFINTKNNCIVKLVEGYHYEKIWQPPFLEGHMPGDRCHVNGFCLDDAGQLKYASMFSQLSEPESWRKNKFEGKASGCIYNIETSVPVVTEINMPHSPRLVGDKLWYLESGTGYICYFDFKENKKEQVAFVPGFLRGMVFYQDYLITTISKPRDKSLNFDGMPLKENIASSHYEEPQCAVYFINLKTNAVEHRVYFASGITELFDVAVIPETENCNFVGLQNAGDLASSLLWK
jgi:uncharacterized protein (TIGR03032 family)